MKHALPLVLLLLSAACSLGLERDPPEQARFLIGAIRPSTEVPRSGGAVVEVRAFHAASALATTRFVYRTGEHRYETDFYREFLVAPELAITDAVRSWLAASGVAAAVVGPGSRIEPTHVLEGDVTALEGDFRRGKGPRAIVELRTALVDRRTGAALAQATYGEEEPLGSADPDQLPAAWSRALARALASLEADLRATLAP